MYLLDRPYRTTRGRLVLISISLAVVIGLGTGTLGANACTIDGKATARADGQLASRTTTPYSTKAAHTWAAFAFDRTFGRSSVVTLTEDRAVLVGVLPSEATGHPWRWQFGDGTTTVGWTVHHRYVHTGTYRITVGAYYPSWKQYFPIDLIRIVVS